MYAVSSISDFVLFCKNKEFNRFRLSHKSFFKNIHGFCLGLFSDVNVWLHGFVIAVAGPLHHYLWSDTVGEGEADEGSSGCMGADKFVFRICFLNSFACPVEYLGNRFVKFYA